MALYSLSIHPFKDAYLDLHHGASRLNSGPDFLLPNHILQLLLWDPSSTFWVCPQLTGISSQLNVTVGPSYHLYYILNHPYECFAFGMNREASVAFRFTLLNFYITLLSP